MKYAMKKFSYSYIWLVTHHRLCDVVHSDTHALQSVGSSPSHHIRLSLVARGDILWWYVFASGWNGLSLLWNCARVTPEVIVVSDASGSSWDVVRPVHISYVGIILRIIGS